VLILFPMARRPAHKSNSHRSAPRRASHSDSEDRTFFIYAAVIGIIVIATAIGIGAYVMAQVNTPPQAAVIPINTATTTPAGPDAYANVSLIAKSAIVYDLTNNQVLYSKNAYTSLPLASVTKLLTLYAATEVLSPDSTVTMSAASLAEVNDTADTGFTAGETFRFEDLARLTLAASSNSGAESIAEAADQVRSTTESALLANAASAIGLSQTHATNATGLDVNEEVSGGYGSAHDMAVLAGALLQKAPQIAEATTLPVVSITSNQGTVHTFSNTDIDVTHIPDPLLSKTGYTDLAGGNLVVVYDAAINHPVAVVVLGSTVNGRFTDVQQLVNATLAHFGSIRAPAAHTQ
jgi:D-alanyl-D-alanine carboxypeptidase